MSGKNWVRRWYLGLVILLLAMIAVGGITRLTRSGLSIVEWRPVSGIVPPVGEAAWQEQFSLYQQSPEFNQINPQFSLTDYQKIFMWEYVHRLLGRLIFLYVLIPGLILWRRKEVAGHVVGTLCVLVMLQGLIGWLMVKSGLNHEPQVSPYMLVLHFFSALTVLTYTYYHLCRLRAPLVVSAASRKPLHWIRGFGLLLLIQLFYGCLTSGFKAGFSFNTFPLMAGEFFPPGGLLRDPAWLNFFVNPAAIQWTHRWLGITLLVVSVLAIKAVVESPEKKY